MAISGGADSVALLCALIPLATECKIRLIAAHLNHGIRPDASEDVAFVQALCRRLGVPLEIEIADVPAAARAERRSLEMQGRTLRYAFFRRIATTHHANAVLTAHTRDDQAETLLLNLCRGCGPAGLGGIPPDTVVQGARIVRPLLAVSRADIEAELIAAGEPWREDATNQDPAFRRNAIRHEILPLIKSHLNPRATEALVRAASLLREDNALVDMLAMEAARALHPADDPGCLRCTPFCALAPPLRRRILVRWLRAGGLAPERTRADVVGRIDRLAAAPQSGGCIRVSRTLLIRREYDGLYRMDATAPRTVAPAPVFLTTPGLTRLPAMECQVHATLARGFVRLPACLPGVPSADVYLRWTPDTPCRILVRQRLPGDRLAMHGMEGSRKLQDILTDAKVPPARRDRIPVFTINGEVVWLPGCRPARAWTVPSVEAPSLHLRVSPLRE